MLTDNIRRRQLDKLLAQYKGLPKAKRGFIREIREALGMENKQLAEKLGVSEPTLSKIQVREPSGSITLKTLERVAEALDCDLVYALVPRTSLNNQVETRALTIANRRAQRIARTMGLEQQSTSKAELEILVRDLAQELLLKGGSELWDGDEY